MVGDTLREGSRLLEPVHLRLFHQVVLHLSDHLTCIDDICNVFSFLTGSPASSRRQTRLAGGIGPPPSRSIITAPCSPLATAWKSKPITKPMQKKTIIDRGHHLVAGSGFGWEGADQALISTVATLAAETNPRRATSHIWEFALFSWLGKTSGAKVWVNCFMWSNIQLPFWTKKFVEKSGTLPFSIFNFQLWEILMVVATGLAIGAQKPLRNEGVRLRWTFCCWAAE